MLDKSVQCDGPKTTQLRYNIESLVSFYDEVKLLRRGEALCSRNEAYSCQNTSEKGRQRLVRG